MTMEDGLWETIEIEHRNPTLFRTSPVSLTVREVRADKTLTHRTNTGLEEIIRDRASAALTHQRIGFSDTYTYERSTNRPFSLPPPYDKKQPGSNPYAGVSSLDARTADGLVSISYV